MNSNIEMSNQEYSDYVDKKAKNSPIFKNMLLAFIVGGLICVIGQLITNLFLSFNIAKEDASTITTIILIFIGASLTAMNVYWKIGKHAGAGSMIPITGFANSIVAPAIEFKTEGYIYGIGANMFKIAGPVLVFGITSSMIVGFVYWILKLVM
ncbi:MAG: stage V sporulation protein AC [Clostridia bacterium]